jgi:DNA-binding NarL/FixJ family response regulator
VKRIRTVFGKDVEFLRKFFGKSIKRISDMDIVDEIDDPVELLVFLREAKVDVILLSLEDGFMSGFPSHLFAEYPFSTLLVVNEDNSSAYIESLCPQRIAIQDVSPEGVINAMRLFTSQSERYHSKRFWS